MRPSANKAEMMGQLEKAVHFSGCQSEQRRQASALLRAWLCFSSLAGFFVFSTPVAGQGLTWSPAGAPAAEATANDLQLALRIRRNLLQDDQLARHRIGVSVREQVAGLWGNVSSKELSQRAEERTRRIIGVNHVHNELRIRPAEEHELPLLSQPPQPRFPLADLPGKEPLRGQEPAAQRRSVVLSWRPAENNLSASGSQKPAKTSQNEGVVVLPAIPMPNATELALRKLSGVLSSQRQEGTEKLVQMIEALRRKDARFTSVRIEVVDGTVSISAALHDPAPLFEFAQAVSRLPGVKRVVLEHTMK